MKSTGKIVTFYSYKGGTGRSMAVANVGFLLATWGFRVLLIDWDLEAPGLDIFFSEASLKPSINEGGVLEMLSLDSSSRIDWGALVSRISIDNSAIDVIKAGKNNDQYFKKVSKLSIDQFYNNGGGKKIELLRDELKVSYDFVLIDSRTGVTDIGGICTIQLPDYLVMMFTPTNQALSGVIEIAEKVINNHRNLPLDRQGLLMLPIASRFDTQQEFELHQEWIQFAATKCKNIYQGWLSADIEAIQLIEATKLPYRPYFSFGEKLAVTNESSDDATGLRYAYENIAAIIANKFELTRFLISDRGYFVNKARTYCSSQNHNTALRVFIAYSHQDEIWKAQVVSHLRALAGENLETWDDRRIEAGDAWQAQIEQAIAQCDVALLLISRHFLTSKFILGNEVSTLLQRREKEGVRVIPVILSPCQWTRIGWIKSIQARPIDGKPLSGFSEHDAEVALSSLAGEVHDFASPTPTPSPQPSPSQGRESVAIDLTHLPAGAPHFLGREAELQQLDAAWAANGQTAIVTIIAPGGVGKTALTKRWLDGLRTEHFRGARRVYGWSFYSQGTSAARPASEDHFITEALKWFQVNITANAVAADKGRALGEAIVQSRTLLILDGVEPLQYPPGPLEGRLRAPGLEALLTHLAVSRQSGLCLLSSRERLSDLAEYERSDQHPYGPILRLDLGKLSDRDGARLLYQQGVQRAGAAALSAEDEELQQASREVRGHALSLSLLGGYLALAYEGDIRRRQEINFAEADQETRNGHAFKVMHAYETWLEQNGNSRELAALRLLAYYDRPASPESLAALRAAPAIVGLTEALFEQPKGWFAFLRKPNQPISETEWRTTLKRLQTLGLVFLPSPAREGGAALLPSPPRGEGPGVSGSSNTPLDAHPLIREYLAHRLQQDQPEAWREGHRRLYEFLKSSVEEQPAGLAGLQPLYQAVAHGCKAGLWQEVCGEVYRKRILRGKEFYSTMKLGAFGADLGAVACFFTQPWKQPAPALSEADQAWLLSVAALNLRALGRLEEALEPMRAGAERAVQQGDWKNAAIRYSNLSELQLTLGRVAAAVADARTAVAHADRSGDAFQRMVNRATLADALHQQGEAAALPLFAEAEALQQEDQPEHPLLYSMRGFQYCEALLAGAERAAWGKMLVGWADVRKPSIHAGTMLGFVPQPNLQDLSTLREDGEAGGGGGPSIAGKPAPSAPVKAHTQHGGSPCRGKPRPRS